MTDKSDFDDVWALLAERDRLRAALADVQTDEDTLAGLDWSQALRALRMVNKIAQRALAKTEGKKG